MRMNRLKKIAIILIILGFSSIQFEDSAFAVKKKKANKGPATTTSRSISVSPNAASTSLAVEPISISPPASQSEVDEVLYQLQESRNVLNDMNGVQNRCESDIQDPVKLRETVIENHQRILCTGKSSIKKFCTEFGKGLVTGGALSTVTQIAAIQCTSLVLGTDATTGNQLVANGVQQAISTGLSAAVMGIYTAWTKCALTPSEGIGEIYKLMKKASAAQFDALPSDVKNRVQAIDGQIDQYISQLAYGNSSFDDIAKRLRRRELVYMLFNTKTRDISRNSTEIGAEDKANIDAELNKILDDYPEHRDALKVVLTRIRDNSSKTNTPNPKTVQIYLYGPPGTGKTTIAERIAKATGQYYCGIPTKDLTLGDLTGAGEPLDTWFQKTDEKLLGKIGDCIRRANGRGILFNFDEIGEILGDDGSHANLQESDQQKQLKSLIKKLFDPNTKKLSFDGLGIEAPISRLTFMGTGNKPLTDAALLERLPQFRFMRLRPSQKATAFRAGYQDAFTRLKNQVTPKQLLEIKNITDQYIEFIYDQDQAFPGGRVVKEIIEEFAVHVKDKVLDRGALDPSELRKFILEAFGRRKKDGGASNSGPMSPVIRE